MLGIAEAGLYHMQPMNGASKHRLLSLEESYEQTVYHQKPFSPF